MRRVGVKEFRDKATTYLASGEVMLVERHGHPVGYFIPVKREDDARAQRIAEVLERTLNQSKLNEDDLIDALHSGEQAPAHTDERLKH